MVFIPQLMWLASEVNVTYKLVETLGSSTGGDKTALAYKMTAKRHMAP